MVDLQALREFILVCKAVCTASDQDRTMPGFLQYTYEAAVESANGTARLSSAEALLSAPPARSCPFIEAAERYRKYKYSLEPISEELAAGYIF